MGFWLQFIYYAHWVLDIAFGIACLSVAFYPMLIARIYIALFLGQQLVLNGCIMTRIQNMVAYHARWTTSNNQFIMAEIFHGWIVIAYKMLFFIVLLLQLYYIYKEITQWVKIKKVV